VLVGLEGVAPYHMSNKWQCFDGSVKTCVVTEHERCEVELPVEGTIVIKTGKVLGNCYISYFHLTITLGVILRSS